MNGKVQVTAYTRTEYNSALTTLTGSADLKIAFGNGGTTETSEIGTEASRNVRISEVLDEDSFTISLNHDSMVISGYALDMTKEVVEAWADTKNLSNDSVRRNSL